MVSAVRNHAQSISFPTITTATVVRAAKHPMVAAASCLLALYVLEQGWTHYTRDVLVGCGNWAGVVAWYLVAMQTGVHPLVAVFVMILIHFLHAHFEANASHNYVATWLWNVWVPLLFTVGTYLVHGVWLDICSTQTPSLQTRRSKPFRPKDMFAVLYTNLVLVVGGLLVVLHLTGPWFPLERTFAPSSHAQDTWWDATFDVTHALATNTVLFYYAHRTLHAVPWLNTHVHAKHHVFTAPCGWAAVYCHPVEMVVGNVVPLFAGPLWRGMPLSTLLGYVMLVVCATQVHHSGLDVWWLHKESIQPQFHDAHHRHRKGNYGSTGWLDRWHGTLLPTQRVHNAASL